jgi:hypothetical protein
VCRHLGTMSREGVPRFHQRGLSGHLVAAEPAHAADERVRGSSTRAASADVDKGT